MHVVPVVLAIGIIELIVAIWSLVRYKFVYNLYERYANWYSDSANRQFGEREFLLAGFMLSTMGAVAGWMMYAKSPREAIIFGTFFGLIGLAMAINSAGLAKWKSENQLRMVNEYAEVYRFGFVCSSIFLVLQAVGVICLSFWEPK